VRSTLLAALLLPLFAGCALFAQEEQLTAEEQYNEAVEFSQSGDVDKAVEAYRNLISTFPQSRYAQQAMLEIAHENYRVQRYEEAIQAAERFRKEYPSHSRIDYAYYIIGLSYFRGERTFFERFSKEDPAERDRQAMINAFNTFSELTRLFPESVYFNDSVERLRYLVNTLARHEAKVARYYLFRQAWVASTSRANHILKRFPDSISNEEALAILVVGYGALGLEQDRHDALRILQLNYPDSPLIEAALAGPDTLLDELDPGRYSPGWLLSGHL
jgi:outer membrane protein assembly factor BamD